MRSQRHQRGMTFVEVLAVLVILGLLAGLLTVSFSGAFGRSKQELAKVGIGMVIDKIESYKIARGRWPDPASGGLDVLTADPQSVFFLAKDKLLDPWGNAYRFVLPGPEGHPYEVYSTGADGARGGTGEDADISSTNLRGTE